MCNVSFLLCFDGHSIAAHISWIGQSNVDPILFRPPAAADQQVEAAETKAVNCSRARYVGSLLFLSFTADKYVTFEGLIEESSVPHTSFQFTRSIALLAS